MNYTWPTPPDTADAASAPAPDLARESLIPAIGPGGRLFPVEKMEAHRGGMLHLAISVFVFCGDRMLIQRRAAGKYHCGRMWANSCCTHPHWGEDLAAAATRRTAEELGLSIALKPAGTLTYFAPVTQGLFEHEQVQVFTAQAGGRRLRLAPNPDEVMDTRLVTRAALDSEVAARPGDFTPWLKIYLSRWDELGFGAHP